MQLHEIEFHDTKKLHEIEFLIKCINTLHCTERIDTNDLYKIIINIYLVNICKLILNYIVLHCNSNVF